MRTNEQALNDVQFEPSNFVKLKTIETGERIEVYPDYFVKGTRTSVKMTDEGMSFLRILCADYLAEKISVEEMLNELEIISKEISSAYSDLVYDRLFMEFTNLLQVC